MDQPKDIAELAKALAAFQSEVSDPQKNKTAEIQPKDQNKPAFRYGYADLAGVLQLVRPLLGKHGLSVVQDVTTSVDHVCVTTHLLHESGQGMTFGPFSLPAGGEPKAWGSAATYARRFALMAALGIAADGDDDAKAAARGATRGRPKLATSSQLRKIGAECERGQISDEELCRVLKAFSVEATSELTVQQASELIDRLIAEVDRRQLARASGADPLTGEVVEDDDGPVPGHDAEGARAAFAERRKPDDGRML